MIVNLYVDHMMNHPPQSAEEVWDASRQNPREFKEAAKQIGLTPSEYREFRQSLLDGKAIDVRLPRKFTAMAGYRHGYVYAVRHAVLPRGTVTYGWEVKLQDGSEVFVPQTCGNLSLVRKPVTIAQHFTHPHATVAYHPRPAAVETPTPVVVEQPVVASAPAAAAPAEAPVVAQNHSISPLFFIPVAIGGIIAGITHGGSTPPVVPPCNQDSNAMGVCQK